MYWLDYECHDCGHKWEVPFQDSPREDCPDCGSIKISMIDPDEWDGDPDEYEHVDIEDLYGGLKDG